MIFDLKPNSEDFLAQTSLVMDALVELLSQCLAKSFICGKNSRTLGGLDFGGLG